MIPDYRTPEEETEDPQRVPDNRNRETLYLIISFGMIQIGAGHGIGPLGLVALAHFSNPLGQAALVGTSLAALRLIPRIGYNRVLLVTGILAMVVAFLLSLGVTQVIDVTLITALPFICILIRSVRAAFVVEA